VAPVSVRFGRGGGFSFAWAGGLVRLGARATVVNLSSTAGACLCVTVEYTAFGHCADVGAL